MSRQKSSQKHYSILLRLKSGKTKEVSVRAATLEVAINRALKKTPEAVDVLNA